VGEREKAKSRYVKKETMLLVSFISLLVGFLGGVVFCSFKFGPEAPAPTSGPPRQADQTRGPSAKQARRIVALEKETRQNPEDPVAWMKLGNAYFDARRFEKAIRAYKKSLELNPNNANIWTDLGVMYRRSGQPTLAVGAFDKAMEIDPLHEISRLNKGIVLMHDLKDPVGAVKAWEELLKINPSAKTVDGRMLAELVEKVKAGMK
jgi:cytochrome c-type biogenesis protein CcmH/NrfG